MTGRQLPPSHYTLVMLRRNLARDVFDVRSRFVKTDSLPPVSRGLSMAHRILRRKSGSRRAGRCSSHTFLRAVAAPSPEAAPAKLLPSRPAHGFFSKTHDRLYNQGPCTCGGLLTGFWCQHPSPASVHVKLFLPLLPIKLFSPRRRDSQDFVSALRNDAHLVIDPLTIRLIMTRSGPGAAHGGPTPETWPMEVYLLILAPWW